MCSLVKPPTRIWEMSRLSLMTPPVCLWCPYWHPHTPPPPHPTPVAVGQEIWGRLMASLLKAAENVCRFTKRDGCWQETWWWNLAVDSAVEGKWRCWKIWNNGGCNEKYEQAKHAVYLSKSWAKSSRTLPAALTYVASPTKWDAKTWMLQLVTGRPGLATAWKEHYECLSNIEFNRDPDFPHSSKSTPQKAWQPTYLMSWWSRPSIWWNVARLLVHPWS